MIRDLRSEHQAVIERLQPYGRWMRPIYVGQGRDNVLHLLHEINNADKHRLLQVVGAKPGNTSWSQPSTPPPPGIVEITGPDMRVLKHGAKVFEAPSGVNVYPKVIPVIAFSEGCNAVKHKGVLFTLRRIAKHVSEIVEGFAPEFS